MVTKADLDGFYALHKIGDPAGDFDGDGIVHAKDYDQFYAHWLGDTSTMVPVDEVRIGYGGYVKDGVTGYLLARNRWYEPAAGRWVTRDPAGYVDLRRQVQFLRAKNQILRGKLKCRVRTTPSERARLVRHHR